MRSATGASSMRVYSHSARCRGPVVKPAAGMQTGIKGSGLRIDLLLVFFFL